MSFFPVVCELLICCAEAINTSLFGFEEICDEKQAKASILQKAVLGMLADRSDVVVTGVKNGIFRVELGKNVWLVVSSKMSDKCHFFETWLAPTAMSQRIIFSKDFDYDDFAEPIRCFCEQARVIDEIQRLVAVVDAKKEEWVLL